MWPSGADPGVGARAARAGTRRPLLATRVGLDLAGIVGAGLIAFVLRFRLHLLEVTRDAPLDVPAHLRIGALWTVALLVSMASHRLYDEDTLAEGGGELSRVRRAVFEAIAVTSVAVFLLRIATVSRGWFALLGALSLGFLWLERLALRAAVARLRAGGRLRRPTLVVTARDDDVPPSIGEFDVVGRVPPEAVPLPLSRVPVEVLLVDDRGMAEADLWRLVLAAGDARLPVYVWSPVRGVARDRLTMRELEGRTIVRVSPPTLAGARGIAKRAFDVAVAAGLLVILALPMAGITLAVLVTSGRPVLHRQQRVGRGGRVFTMWKFRTMRTDAETAGLPGWTVRDDPRRTGIGRASCRERV